MTSSAFFFSLFASCLNCGADPLAEKIDPVYSLLKCAADLPRQNKPGPQGHACCMRSQELNAVRNSSRSSSPSSGMSSFKRVLYSLLFGRLLGFLMKIHVGLYIAKYMVARNAGKCLTSSTALNQSLM